MDYFIVWCAQGREGVALNWNRSDRVRSFAFAIISLPGLSVIYYNEDLPSWYKAVYSWR